MLQPRNAAIAVLLKCSRASMHYWGDQSSICIPHILCCGSLSKTTSTKKKQKGEGGAVLKELNPPPPRELKLFTDSILNVQVLQEKNTSPWCCLSALLERLVSLYHPIPDKVTNSFFIILRAPHRPPPSPAMTTVFAPVLTSFESHVGMHWIRKLHWATRETIWKKSSHCELSCRNWTHKNVRKRNRNISS